MKHMIAIATTTVMTVLVALTLSVAAQQTDTRDKTIMTFSNAVELPGMKLAPGTYVFRLADTAGRNVVQVLSGDEAKVLGQWLFVSAQRQEVTGDTVVTFRETSAASTPAVQFWYYPGEKIGKEFIYPRDQALRIAARTGATVQSEEGPVTANSAVQASAQQPRSQTDGVAASEQARSTVPAESRRAVPETQVAERAPAASDRTAAAGDTGRVRQESTIAQDNAQSNTFARNELPDTASSLPLSGLIALLSLAGAAGIRAFRSPLG